MRSFVKRRMLSNSVKEALDNLPSGICFFDVNGTLVLCNRRMYRIAFLLMGHDLQMMSELQEALGLGDGEVCDGRVYRLSDDSRWSFSMREIAAGRGRRYMEFIAFDVSELHQKQELLREANEAKSQTVETLERIQDNIIAIAREEEILAMKMGVHNEFGYHLQTIRRFYARGCPADEKADFLASQREMLERLRGELEGSDAVDSFDELERLAETLGMRIETKGEIPAREDAKELVVEALRECLTNTIRHAGGDRVFLEITYGKDGINVGIANNGSLPAQEIVESGGLASLRKRVERAGGTMIVRSTPEFRLLLQLPMKQEKEGGGL